jgi:hypothetical protein
MEQTLPFHLLSTPPKLVRLPSISEDKRSGPSLCQICLSDDTAQYILLGKAHTCGHVVCGTCLKTYISNINLFRCPTCKMVIHRKNVRRIRN